MSSRLRCVAHWLPEALGGQIGRGLAGVLLIVPQAPGGLLQGVDSIRELLLLAGEPAPRVGRAAPFAIEPLRFARDAPLRLRDLLRLELQIAERPPLRTRRSLLHPRLGVAQLARRLFAFRRRSRRIVLLPLRRRVAHLFDGSIQILLGTFGTLSTVRPSTVGTSGTISSFRTIAELFRRLFHLPPQLFLLSRQLFELTLHLFRGQAALREVALLPAQLFLPAREVLDLVERAVGPGPLGLRLDLGLGFVAVLRLALQLAIEQVRQILSLAIAVASDAPLLLLLHLTVADVGLRLEQGVQRRHLVRNRVGGLLRLQLLERAAHRVDGVAHRIAGRRVRTRRPRQDLQWRFLTNPAALPRGAGRLLGAPLQLRLRVGDVLDVGPRPPGRRAPLEVPRRADDFLLRRDQSFHLLGGARRHSRLALRQRVLLVERPHFEEEDLAPSASGLIPPRNVPRPRVVDDDVAGPYTEVFGGEHAGSDPREPGAAKRREGDDLFRASADGIDHVQARDAEVVVRARLDRDFLERRNLRIAGRAEDVHVGRPVVHHSDEVLDPFRAQAVRIDQADAVRRFIVHHEDRFEPAIAHPRQGHRGLPL